MRDHIPLIVWATLTAVALYTLMSVANVDERRIRTQLGFLMEVTRVVANFAALGIAGLTTYRLTFPPTHDRTRGFEPKMRD